MSDASKLSDEIDTPHGHDVPLAYKATEAKRGGGTGEFLWFVTADRAGDQIFPVADIRRMTPPTATPEVAYIHFSGVCVKLHGVHLRRVLHRIAVRRCAALLEIQDGQRRPPAGEPVIERMEFLDMTKPAPKGKGGRPQAQATAPIVRL